MIEILPVTAPVGTVAVTFVLEFTVKTVDCTVPNLTIVACDKLIPVITTCVPTGPLVGLKLVMLGMTLKFCSDCRFPVGSFTVIKPVVAPAASLARQEGVLDESKGSGACAKQNASRIVESWPSSPTEAPTLPE